MHSIHVLKFGGTSLRDASLINQAADIIAERKAQVRPIVIVSAIAGVTDGLLKAAHHVHSDSVDTIDSIHQLKKQHLRLLDEIAEDSSVHQADLASLFDELQTVFDDRAKRDDDYGPWLDQLLSFGERASVQLMEAALKARNIPARRFEAQHFIKTDASFGEANVLSDLTKQQVRRSLNGSGEVPVITGFIGSTRGGAITTLGRSGSDYTASLIAGALCADLLEIWTDVDGVLTADPDIVPTAQSIEMLSYDDIAELSAHGARVVHPKTIDPLRNCNIPMQVRNSLNPEHPGTKITKTFSSNGHFRSVTVTGPFTQIEIPASSYQLFYHWLEKCLPASGMEKISSFNTSVAEPTQFVIPDDLYRMVEDELSKWFIDNDIETAIIENLFQVKKFANALLQDDATVTSVLQTLAREEIQPIQWHRGHNRRHVSLLLREKDARRAAQLMNDISPASAEKIALFIAGTGAVGGTLVNQIKKLDNHNFHLMGSCNTRNVQWFSTPSDKEATQPTEWPDIIKKLTRQSHPELIFVDATGSEEVARWYPDLFKAGIHIVTPSKLANTFEQSYYDLLRQTAAENNALFRYETTVGAGLPVLSTINDLQKTGDRITEISGVVSGTMTYLFNQLEEGVPFSEAILDAREQGYAEPDPRDDLSGEDVARKFLTLARETGVKIERSELQVQSLIPDELGSLDAEKFLERLPEVDQKWNDKLEDARKNDATLCYTGTLLDGNITIGVEEVPQNAPLGNLKGADNLIRISTERYHDTPLIIQGPGAGKQVTAAGVLADLMKIAEEIK